jgi:hypothetical protein
VRDRRGVSRMLAVSAQVWRLVGWLCRGHCVHEGERNYTATPLHLDHNQPRAQTSRRSVHTRRRAHACSDRSTDHPSTTSRGASERVSALHQTHSLSSHLAHTSPLWALTATFTPTHAPSSSVCNPTARSIHDHSGCAAEATRSSHPTHCGHDSTRGKCGGVV